MKEIENQVILITGATDGLGKQVAHNLAVSGATILLHGRDEKKGQSTLEQIKSASGNDKLHYYNADFSSLVEVKKLAERIKEDFDELDILINNAGVGFGEPGSGRDLSDDGLELRFQVNYLAGFLLTKELLPLIQKSDTARIVNVSSIAQTPIEFDDVMLENNYSGNRAYGQSKLAQILFTVELTNRLDDTGVTVNALHPATYMNTKMVSEADINPINSVQKGADAVEYLATSDELDSVSGEFFNGKHKSRANSQAYNDEARKKLWELSEELIEKHAG
ncbi:MAG: SDR family oxidoreductase [Balneolaceae bacterium]|nr:SDR family oxidoreductase [Balneolaceae bacterium]